MSSEADEPADGSEGNDQDEGDQPEMTEEEMADFSAVADKIESEPEPGADTSENQGDETSKTEGERRDDVPATEGEDTSEPDLSIGDIYCNGLGMVAAVSRSRYGSADPDDREELVEEYSDMARQIELDQYLDQWFEQNRGLDSLSPGQAVVLGTMMWGAMVAVDDPEMIENVGQGVRGDD